MVRPLRLLPLILLLAACSRPAMLEQKPEPGDAAAAKVGGETVWVSDVRRAAVAQGVIGEGEPLDAGSEPFDRVLQQLIDQRLLARGAEDRRLDGDPIVRRKLLAARGKVMGDALIETEVDKAVTEGEIRRLYDEEQARRKAVEELHLRQVVLPAEADAEAAKKQLASGAPFEAVAMQRSIDGATRFNGGDLGWRGADALPEGWDLALRGAQPGQLLGPFHTGAGWVVARLDERRAQPPITLEEARPQIVRFLTLDQVRILLQQLRARTPVQVLVKPAPDGKEPASAPAAAAAPHKP